MGDFSKALGATSVSWNRGVANRKLTPPSIPAQLVAIRARGQTQSEGSLRGVTKHVSNRVELFLKIGKCHFYSGGLHGGLQGEGGLRLAAGQVRLRPVLEWHGLQE